MKAYVLHENPEWIPPFADAFADEGLPWEEWVLDGGTIDLDAPPPDGVFWSRMSASSHTRGHTGSKDHTRATLAWLEGHGRRVVNGRRVLELEMSKVEQHAALRAAGIDVPRTIAVVGTDDLVAQARRLPVPFITKHNQGGKGLGVRRFDSVEELAAYVSSDDFEEPQDGITLLQEFVQAAEPRITRVEIVAGELVYAIDADTARGGFQPCPADACAIDPSTGALIMPPGATIPQRPGDRIFSLREDFDSPVLDRYLEFARRTGIEVLGIEFLEDAAGRIVTYDVNTNTNYNADVEAVAPRSGPGSVVAHLGRLLQEHYAAETLTR